ETRRSYSMGMCSWLAIKELRNTVSRSFTAGPSILMCVSLKVSAYPPISKPCLRHSRTHTLTKRDCERTLSKGLETGIVFGDVHPATVAMVVHDQELLVIAEGSVPPTLPPGNAYGA